MGKNIIFKKSRILKTLILISVDIFFIFISYWLSMWLRLDRETPYDSWYHWKVLSTLILLTIVFLLNIGFYRSIVKYISFRIIRIGAIGAVFSTLLLVVISLYSQVFLPRTVPLIYFALLIIFLCGIRLTYKLLFSHNNKKGLAVIIYGAGEAGRQLLLALAEDGRYQPVAFVDDNQKLHGLEVHGIRVFSSKKINGLIAKFKIKKVLLAMPSTSLSNKKRILHRLEKSKCEVLSIPGFIDLVEGKVTINSLKRVSIEELLGRDPVEPIQTLLNKNILNKNLMVTGAGGSIGSELCRQIILQKPNRIILFELSEYALYMIEQELSLMNTGIELISILGDVKDKVKLNKVLSKYSINTIYHAAAYKHVPLVETNIISGVYNNVLGTLNCAKAAIENNVEKFVLISTDKAVRPTNIMGATKRLAELILQALSKEHHNTHFSMVRFGNVLGSSGSVIPLFEKQIAKGGPLTLTHYDIIRYFMTIPEAALLVIQAGAMGNKGDVFVLDMGEPIKIYDLAKKMIRLNGLTIRNNNTPDGDIEIRVTGLRPGEKLFEELLIGGDVHGTLHPRIMVANEEFLLWDELSILLDKIFDACNKYDIRKVRDLLTVIPTKYTPKDDICDRLF